MINIIKQMKKILISSIFFLIIYIWGVSTAHFNLFPYSKKNLIKKIFNVNEDSIKKSSEKKNREDIIKKYRLKDPYLLSFKPAIKKYNTRAQFWSDRVYYNHKNDEKILNFHVLTIPRHLKNNIYLTSLQDVEIFRPTCMRNNNSIYDKWNKVDFDILIIGESCIHKKIFKKKFKKGEIKLDPGGTASSDPILIKDLKDIALIKIKDKK